MNNKVILQMELINHILSFRPTHPIAKLIIREFNYFNKHKNNEDKKFLREGISEGVVILKKYMCDEKLKKSMANIQFYNTNNYTKYDINNEYRINCLINGSLY
jgi:hypothetical protein